MTMIAFGRGEDRFNLRVAGIALDGDRVLLQTTAGDDFWTFPGGRPELGEPAARALEREMREEVGVRVEVGRLLFVVENFFRYEGKRYHEIGLYFLMRMPVGVPLPDGPVSFSWVRRDAATLSRAPIRPSFFESELSLLPESVQHVVHGIERP